jgi:hypothetical protein
MIPTWLVQVGSMAGLFPVVHEQRSLRVDPGQINQPKQYQSDNACSGSGGSNVGSKPGQNRPAVMKHEE